MQTRTTCELCSSVLLGAGKIARSPNTHQDLHRSTALITQKYMQHVPYKYIESTHKNLLFSSRGSTLQQLYAQTCFKTHARQQRQG